MWCHVIVFTDYQTEDLLPVDALLYLVHELTHVVQYHTLGTRVRMWHTMYACVCC